MKRPDIEDVGQTLHATECGEIEAGPHGLTLVFTEDRGFSANGPTRRMTVARVAISAEAAAHMAKRMTAALAVIDGMRQGGSATKN